MQEANNKICPLKNNNDNEKGHMYRKYKSLYKY